MELAKAGIFVLAILLIYPYDECSGASTSYPVEKILRSIQDNFNHQHHHQRSQSNDHQQDDRHQNEQQQYLRHQRDHQQDDRHQSQHQQNDRHQNEQQQYLRYQRDHQQDDRHDNEYHQNDRHQNSQQQYLRHQRDHQQDDRHQYQHQQDDRHQRDHQQDDRHQYEHQQDDRHQNHHHHNDRHSNNRHDLRWSRPQEYEIIHATNDVSPILVLGKPTREQDEREVNDPVVLDMEVKPIETQYEIISAKDIDTEQKPQITADKKLAKLRKSQHRPKASVHENIAVNSLKYSKISKLNK